MRRKGEICELEKFTLIINRVTFQILFKVQSVL